MFIPIKKREIIYTEEEKESMYFKNWIGESHKWVEIYQGYYTCEFCNMSITNQLPFDRAGLCHLNPYLIDELNKNKL